MTPQQKENLKKYYKIKLTSDQRWLERAVVAIFERQTNDEQVIEGTKYQNNRGYRPSDAKQMSYYAKWIMSGKHLNNYHANVAVKRIEKYIGQLIIISQQKYMAEKTQKF